MKVNANRHSLASPLAVDESAGRLANPSQSVWRDPWFWGMLAVVALLYCQQIATLPIRGEESRWARGAALMLESGDWIVPRQQGVIFPDRPPLGSWCMAIVGWLRGGVDLLAVRLPSMLAIVATCGLLYAYGRRLLSPLAALLAAGGYATFGQVLQIGRYGESEAIFALLLVSSLLVWHAHYLAGRASWQAWAWGYSLAALAALTKGPQGPVYFVVVTWAFLLLQRDWRYLFSWGHLAGWSLGIAILLAWTIPFYLLTDWQRAIEIWMGLSSDRVTYAGLLEHIATYPLETFACLLPWSLFLVQFAFRPMRERAWREWPTINFWLLAIALTYPTVWFVAGARGRYYMPLYPCFALLIAWVIQSCLQYREGIPRRSLQLFLVCGVGLAVLVPVGLLVAWQIPSIEPLQQLPFPWITWGALTSLGIGFGWLFWRSLDQPTLPRAAVLMNVAWLGILYGGIVLPIQGTGMNDPTPVIAQLRTDLGGKPLVSFGPIFHRFNYYYVETIWELPWPEEQDARSEQLEEVEYFCFDFKPGDTNEMRDNGRTRKKETSPGTLPFLWEEVARIDCGWRKGDTPTHVVVIGRIVRDDRGHVAWAPGTPAVWR